MLQKDGENVSRALKENFRDEVEFLKGKKGSVVFKLVNSIFDGKKKKPRSYHIPNAYVGSDHEGMAFEMLVYNSKKPRQTKAGLVLTDYLPPSIIFSPRGDLVIPVAQKDLIIYLLNHPRRAKNKLGDGKKKPLFYLEDKNKEAQEKVLAKSAKAKMEKYLYDDESRLPEEDLREIAKALQVPGVDEMQLALVQTSIEDHCRNNPNKFLQYKGVGKEVKMRSNLHSAIESGIISYDGLKRKWLLKNKNTKKDVFIAPVRSTENEMDALVLWLKNLDTDNTYSKIMELLTGNIQPTKESLSKEAFMKAESEKLRLENENLRLQLQLKDKKKADKVDAGVSEEVIELRKKCDELGIEYHHANKQEALERLIRKHEAAVEA